MSFQPRTGSTSSDNRSISPCTFESDVPPLMTSGRLLKQGLDDDVNPASRRLRVEQPAPAQRGTELLSDLTKDLRRDVAVARGLQRLHDQTAFTRLEHGFFQCRHAAGFSPKL
jgi:hypothetical protein